MFNKGILKGLKVSIPVGGHLRPSSKFGERLEWKNPQKNEIKKKISDVINNIIPHFNPRVTCLVWKPWWVLSRVTSRHQVNIVIKIIIDPNLINSIDFKWKSFVDPDNRINTPKAPVKGQGLTLTKW